MQGVSFGVFGLGNKQYEHFCAVGKRMHRALAALGATALVQRGEGDDDDDIEADFEAWRTELYAALDKATVLAKAVVRRRRLCYLWSRLVCALRVRGKMCRLQSFCAGMVLDCPVVRVTVCTAWNATRRPDRRTRAQGPPGVTQVIAAADSVPGYEVEVLTGADADAAAAEAAMSPALASGDGTAASAPFGARVAVVRELHTPTSERSCLHVELDVSGSGIRYEAGDHVRTAAPYGCFLTASVLSWQVVRSWHERDDSMHTQG